MVPSMEIQRKVVAVYRLATKERELLEQIKVRRGQLTIDALQLVLQRT